MVDVSHRMKNYFLGAIILKQTSTGAATMGDHKIVIDGQQRLDHGISKTKPRVRHLINVKEPHFFHFEA